MVAQASFTGHMGQFHILNVYPNIISVMLISYTPNEGLYTKRDHVIDMNSDSLCLAFRTELNAYCEHFSVAV